MPALQNTRRRTGGPSSQSAETTRQRNHSSHSARISSLKPRFAGLDERQVVSAKHPLELKYPNITLNSLQRAMVYCIEFCGGAATDEELEAFCSLYWRAIERYSQRRTEYSGMPNKRIFKIIFSIKKNGFPLFVECPEDKTKHQVYVPKEHFQDRLLQILRTSPDGFHIDELVMQMDQAEFDGFFKDLPCARRVRALLLVYRRKNMVEFCEESNKWRMKAVTQQKPQNSTKPDLLSDLQVSTVSLEDLFAEIKRRNLGKVNRTPDSDCG